MPKLKKFFLGTVAVVNGTAYMALAAGGGFNLKRLIGNDSDAVSWTIIAISIEASVVYTLFTYKNFQGVSLRINSLNKGLFALLSPLTAASFLTGGLEGSERLGLPQALGITIASTLYVLRIIACIDAEIKFPRRFLEVTNSTYNAALQKDLAKLIRVAVMLLIMMGYLASITDGIYHSAYMGINLLTLTTENKNRLSFASSVLGAIGAIPTCFYWVHQGLLELTFGMPKTDRYTFIAMVIILPTILGIFGALAASNGKVFGQLGVPSLVVRLTTSVLYGILTNTPGMASFLRHIRSCEQNDNPEPSPPAITVTAPTPTSSPRNRHAFFAIEMAEPGTPSSRVTPGWGSDLE